jgi:hypothetical protein
MLLDMLTRKGVNPYEHMTSYAQFDEGQLPPIEAFTSSMAGETSAEDYLYGQRVWVHFGCRTMREYHDLYLLADVMLLSDVFETFRGVTQESWSLDPAHNPTLPSLGWDGLLKTTTLGPNAVRLELLTDPDMYMMCESDLRGGLCYVMERYAKANNSMVEGYDAEKPTSYNMYDDANNLYRPPMIESKLPSAPCGPACDRPCGAGRLHAAQHSSPQATYPACGARRCCNQTPDLGGHRPSDYHRGSPSVDQSAHAASCDVLQGQQCYVERASEARGRALATTRGRSILQRVRRRERRPRSYTDEYGSAD